MLDFLRFKLTFLVLVISVVYCNGFNDGLDLRLRAADDESIGRCRYRDHPTLYPADEIWRYITGFWCFHFTNPIRLADVNLTRTTIRFRNYTIPYVILDGTTAILFDYQDESYSNMIEGLFRTSRFFTLWEDCSRLGRECCDYHLNETNIFPTETHVCPALWDGWDCWPPARAGETKRRVCPEHSYSSDEIVCELESEKYCLEDDWDHMTNYTGCASAPILRRRHQYHVLVLIISTSLTFPAVVIFFIFMRNQKDLRHVLHRNLLISIVLKNIFTIVSKEVIILDALQNSTVSNGVMDGNSPGCRVLSFFDTLATVSVFTCMLLVGYYLHSTIARIFGKTLSLTSTYVITIGFTVVPSLAWGIAMAAAGMEDCWVVDTEGFHWITDAYKYAVLIVNLFLLLDITRVICFQRSSSRLNPKQTRDVAKAILVLIPLFGLPLLLTSQRSMMNQNSCLSGDIYYFTAYTVEALQGIIVALLFCYLHKEVHNEIRKRYRKWIIEINSRFGTDFKVPTQARVTTMTNVRPSGLDTMKVPHYPNMMPPQSDNYPKIGSPTEKRQGKFILE